MARRGVVASAVQDIEASMDVGTAERLARIEEQLKALPELKELLESYLRRSEGRDGELEGMIRSRELYCAASMPRVDQVIKEVGGMDLRLAAVEKLAPAMRAMLWVGVALGGSVIALIWSLITGQATLIFR
jgi:hypothetical protein